MTRSVRAWVRISRALSACNYSVMHESGIVHLASSLFPQVITMLIYSHHSPSDDHHILAIEDSIQMLNYGELIQAF